MHNVRFAAPAGRLLLSLIFLLSGVSKATDPTGTMAYIAAVIGIDFGSRFLKVFATCKRCLAIASTDGHCSIMAGRHYPAWHWH